MSSTLGDLLREVAEPGPNRNSFHSTAHFDEFEAWVAAGTPADSPLLRFGVLKFTARMELGECPADPEARSAPPM